MCVVFIAFCCYAAILKLCAYPFATRHDACEPGPFQIVKNGRKTTQGASPDGECGWYAP